MDGQTSFAKHVTFYVRDASGNVMAVYEHDIETPESYHLSERHIYGSSRVGMITEKVEFEYVYGNQPTEELVPTLAIEETVNFELEYSVGKKQYELSNHLGNVLAVISDWKVPVISGASVVSYTSVVVSSQDYSPFGVTLEGRSWSAGYRYGFQNQETDNEMWGGAINYKYRVEDPRLGRFFSVDPLYVQFPWNSNYAFSENRVLDGVELEGCEWQPYLNRFIYQIESAFTDVFESIGNYHITKAEMDAAMSKSLVLQTVKSAFSEQLPKDLIDHYAYGEGRTYYLDEQKMALTHPSHTGIQGLTTKDIKSFNSMLATLPNDQSSKIDRYITGIANVGGTLGRFTIHFVGTITKSKDGKSWEFAGEMEFIDTWDFKTDPTPEGDVERTSWGDTQTKIGGAVLQGDGFPIQSAKVKVKQRSTEKILDWFKGKSQKSIQNEVSNEKGSG
jgi:RHS repeat-associated protein